MYAKGSPSFYLGVYLEDIIEVMEKLRDRLSKGDYNGWREDMSNFTDSFRI